MISQNLWGEIPEATEERIPDVASDIAKSMTKFNLADFESVPDEDSEYVGCLFLEYKDPLMLHAIALHKYYNQVADLIKSAETALDSKCLPPNIEAPPIPEVPEIIHRYEKNVNFLCKDLTPLSKECEIEVPEISEEIVKDLLFKSLVVMLTHAGFENTHQSVLDLLRDVLESFLQKITYQLKVTSDDEEKGQLFDFPSPIEKVLVDLGMNGIAGLHDYYETRVVKYIFTLQKRCQEVKECYESLLIPTLPCASIKEVKVKIENAEEMDDPTVIHVPANDSEIGYSFMDAGFQLLNSLEANLKSMSEADTEGTIHLSSVEQT